MNRYLLLVLTSAFALPRTASAAAAVSGDVTLLGGAGAYVRPTVQATTPGTTVHLELGSELFRDEHLWFDATLDVRVNSTFAIADNASRLELGWRAASWAEGDRLTFELMPFSSHAVHLGVSWPVQWGRRLYFDGVAPFVPALRSRLRLAGWDAFVAVRTGLQINDVEHQPEPAAMILGGVDRTLPGGFHAGVQGEWGPSRPVPSLAAQGLNVAALRRGATLYATYQRGAHVGAIADSLWQGDDPYFFEQLADLPKAIDGLAIYASAEATMAFSDLAKPDTFGAKSTQQAKAAAVEVRAQYGRTRAQLLASYRDFSFIDLDRPGFPPYLDFASGSRVVPEARVRLAADLLFESIHLTPGAAVTVSRPAGLTAPAVEVNGIALANHTVVEYGEGIGVRADAEEPAPTFGGELLLRWDPRDAITLAAQVGWSHDPNTATFRQEPSGQIVFVQDGGDVLTAGLNVQVRF